MDNEIIQTQEISASTAMVYQQDKAAIDVQISTAKAFPRNIKRSMENAIAIVTIDAQTAATCTYSLPRGDKPISGPSVHLAKILAQVWGNLRIEAKVVDIGSTQITSQAIAFDLENNLAIKVEVKRSIMSKRGRFNDDMITVTGNAANSIALRNAVLSVIPRAVVDKVYDSAKQAITGNISDEAAFIKKRSQIFDGFKNTYGVEESEVLSLLGKNALGQVTSDDLVVLIGIGQAIKDGDTTIESVLNSYAKKSGDPKDNATAAIDKLHSKLKPEAKSAEDKKEKTPVNVFEEAEKGLL